LGGLGERVGRPKRRVHARRAPIVEGNAQQHRCVGVAAPAHHSYAVGDQRVLEGLRLELQPSRIRLEVDTIEQHSVPLTFDQVDMRGGSVLTRLKSDTAQFSPPTAIVLGQAIAIGEFQKRTGRRFRASFDSVPGAGSGRQITVPLELVDQEELGLRFAAVPMLTAGSAINTRTRRT
jgi:hypothetical protein